MKFHHVGIACEDINEQIEHIKNMHRNVQVSEVVFDKEQNAHLCMITLDDGNKLELIAGKVVENLIKKRISYYHVCYEVSNIEQEIARLTQLGGILVSEIKPAILFNYKPVAFMQVSYGLIELLQS